MNLIERVLKDIGAIDKCKTTRPFDIKNLGYRFSKRKIPMKDTAYLLCEILDADTLRAASFCFLLSQTSNMGIVIPKPYEYYHEFSVEELKASRAKKKSQNAQKRSGSDDDAELV